MTDHEEKSGAPMLRLVSEKPAHDIDIVHAKQKVTRQLATLAASILRTIAGSESAEPVMRCVLGLVDAQKELVALTGCLLAPGDVKQALKFTEPELRSGTSDIYFREYRHALGMEQIVRGALRLTAHQVLGEREHFGGKYSSLAIEKGIATVKSATEGSQNRKRNRRKVIL